MGNKHMCENTIDGEVYTEIFERHLCYHQGDIFSYEVRSYFSRTMPELVLLKFITARLHRHSVCVLDWPVCSPNGSTTENVWSIMIRGESDNNNWWYGVFKAFDL